MTANPRRVAAGRLNGARRRPWGDADRLRLSIQCRERRPWLASTGPRSDHGKRRSAANGHARRPEPDSLRQLRAALRDARQLIRKMATVHQAIRAAAAGEDRSAPEVGALADDHGSAAARGP